MARALGLSGSRREARDDINRNLPSRSASVCSSLVLYRGGVVLVQTDAQQAPQTGLEKCASQ